MKGEWTVYCDICGRKCLSSDVVKLSRYTGRGELIVCKFDVDKIDYGTVPYRSSPEQVDSRIRNVHNDSDGSPIVNMEEMELCYYLAASQDNAILTLSQDTSIWLVVCDRI